MGAKKVASMDMRTARQTADRKVVVTAVMKEYLSAEQWDLRRVVRSVANWDAKMEYKMAVKTAKS